MEQHNPASIAPPVAAYSHGMETPPGARWLHISGQVGMEPTGAVPDGIEAQAERAWRNIGEILASAGMSVTNIVKITTYLISRDDLPGFVDARRKYLGDFRPASTLVYVAGLVRPEFRVEIEVIAARA